MGETLGFVLCLIIVYLIYKNWSFICMVFGVIVGMVLLYYIGKAIFHIYSIIKNYVDEKNKNAKNAIEKRIKEYVNGTQEHRFKTAKTYLDSLKGKHHQHAKEFLQESKEKIHKDMIFELDKGKFTEAAEKIVILKDISTKEESANYDKILKRTEEMKKYCVNVRPYIMSNNYGEAKNSILLKFKSIEPEMMRRTMEANSLLDILWFFAINYDRISYKTVLSVMENIKVTYNVISIEVLASLMYIETKKGSAYVEINIDSKYLEKKKQYIERAGKVALRELASFAKYVGDEETEIQCLEKLSVTNSLTVDLVKRYTDLVKV